MDLSNYATVPERMQMAFTKYPDLRIVERPVQVREIDGHTFIEVTVYVYRDPEDGVPAVATAWEPFPGKSAFTRDSEMMNASTSAIGRALGMMGFGYDRSLASADEVNTAIQRRSEPPERAQIGSRAENSLSDRLGTPRMATPAQRTIIKRMAAERGVEAEEVGTFDEASAEITRLKGIPKP